MSNKEMVTLGGNANEIQVVGRTDGSVRPIAVPDGVTKGTFYRAVAAYDAAFRTKGAQPEVDDVMLLAPRMTKKQLASVMGTESFKQAMLLRGIGSIQNDGLTIQQAAVLNILEDFSDPRTLSAKLKSAGVPRAAYNAWLKDPIFARMYEQRIESHLRQAHLSALSTIMTIAENGDLRAAEKVLEINGRYNPQAVELQNARAVVQSLVESMQRHIKDPAVLKAIIDEVGMARQVARLAE
jgi:hypothetical protein